MNTLEKFDSKTNYARHAKSHTQGGIQLKEQEGSNINTREVLLNLIKSVGGKLKEGKILDLLKISRPAIISYSKTYLECVADDFIYSEFLNKAAELEDPIERLKYVAAFYIAGLHVNPSEMGSCGPLNPILGETFYGEKPDGTKVYCEQISHHPPVSAYLMRHSEGAYELYGTGETVAKLSGMNGIIGQRIGETVIKFKNGSKIFVKSPEMKIDGLVMGDRVANYMKSFAFIDQQNKVSAEVTFNYEDVGALSKMTSAFKGLFKSSAQPEKPLFDSFTIVFYSFDHDKETKKTVKTERCKGSGSWLSHMEVDNEVLWRIENPHSGSWKTNDQSTLISDSIRRLDSKYIRERNFDQAQKEKDTIENLQRSDAKLRKINKEKV